jgi:predicted HNH restriction endonuclease
MEEVSERARRAKKAWETMKSKDPGGKAHDTRRRKEGARKAVIKIEAIQWEPKKMELLKKWGEEAIPDTCIICGDSRPFVLQEHHLEPDGERLVKLCANCHDLVRRSTDIKDLEEPHRAGSYFSRKAPQNGKQ